MVPEHTDQPGRQKEQGDEQDECHNVNRLDSIGTCRMNSHGIRFLHTSQPRQDQSRNQSKQEHHTAFQRGLMGLVSGAPPGMTTHSFFGSVAL